MERQSHWWNRPASWVLILLVASYAIYFSCFCIRRHQAHLTAGFDLGIVDQAMWNTIRGRPLSTSVRPGIDSRLGLHFEPILFLLAPLYLVHEGPETLLVVQAVMVALGAIPVFWLARDQIGEWPAAGFAAAYLLFPALEAANSFDFHALTLSPGLLATALWAIRRRRYRLFALAAALAMGCKEEVSLTVALMGVLVLLSNRDLRPGAITVAAAVTWFVVASMIVISARNRAGVNIHYTRYPDLGDGLAEMAVTLLTRPGHVLRLLTQGEKALTLVRLSMPVGFLALADPPTLALVVPTVAINLLTGYRPMHALDAYHYWAPAVPFIVAAAAAGTRRLAEVARKRLRVRSGFVVGTLTVMILVLSLGYHRVLGYTPLRIGFVWPQVTAHDRLLEALIAQIPTEAAVCAQNPLAPHVSQREYLMVFPHLDGAEYVLLDQTAPAGAEVVEDQSVYSRTISALRNSGRYVLLDDRDGYLLFRRLAAGD